ncbi:MAG: lamin tail domain-containing protein [bacterium]|nr:lamin tail domain-containing protein [bacterium]
MKTKRFGKEIFFLALILGIMIAGGWTMSGCGIDEDQQQKIVSKFIDSDNDGLSDNDEIMKYHTGLASRDTDGDGLLDGDEVSLGTDPLSSDTDEDGMPDGWEVQYGLDPLYWDDRNWDLDGDSLSNVNEYQYGTLPNNPDTDEDGMPDGWEVQYGLNPTSNDADWDNDSDGLTNYQEYLRGTNPNNPDTDGDTFQDGWEVLNGFNPLNASDPMIGDDGDRDGIPDNLENILYQTSPNSADTDGDGYPDKFEIDNGSDPSDPNSIPDVTKVVINEFFAGKCTWVELYNVGSEPVNLGNWTLRLDLGSVGVTDQKISDAWGNFTLAPKQTVVLDTANGTNTASHRYANACDTYCDSVGSYGAAVLINHTGTAVDFVRWGGHWPVTAPNPPAGTSWSAAGPIYYGCPAGDSLQRNIWGTDTDTEKDWSVGFSTPGQPNSPDSDGDGLSDWAEANINNTDPGSADTDGDGYPDGLEVAKGTDPNSASSSPAGIIPEVEPNGTAAQCTTVGDLGKQAWGQLYPRYPQFTEFYEDFSDGTFTDTFQALGGGTNNLRNYDGHTNSLCVYGNVNNIHAYTKQSFSGDMLFDFDYRLNGSAGDGGVFFGVKNQDNGILMALRPGGWEIYSRIAGNWYSMTAGQINNLNRLYDNQWDHFQIVVRDGVYQLYENETYRGSFLGPLNIGSVGLRGWENSSRENCIDNVRVASLPRPPETFFTDFSHSNYENNTINIISAVYGKNGYYCDQTNYFRSQCNGASSCSAATHNGICGDPLAGTYKAVIVRYTCGNESRSLIVGEGGTVSISCYKDSLDTFQQSNSGALYVSTVGNHTDALCGYNFANDIHAYTQNMSFNNGVLEFDYYLKGGNPDGGVFFRAQDSEHGYLLALASGSWNPYRRTPGNWSGISVTNYSGLTIGANRWHHFKLVMDGGNFSLFEEGVLRGTFVDYKYTSGGVGLRAPWHGYSDSTCIDNLSVVPLTPEFSEDFSEQVYLNNFQEDGGGNQFVQTMGNHDTALCSYNHGSNDIHLFTKQTFGDGVFEFDYYLQGSAGDGGVFLRAVDRGNGLLISLDPAAWQAYVGVGGAGVWYAMPQYNYSALTIGNNHWHHFKVLMNGNRFDLFEEGSYRGTFYDTGGITAHYPRGSIGLRGIEASDRKSCIDNIRVTPAIPDTNYYCFNASAGQQLYIDTDAEELDSPTDSLVSLYGTDGITLLAWNDDAGSYYGGHDSILPYTFGGAGTYYLAVQGSGWGREAYHPYFVNFKDIPGAQDSDGDGLTDLQEYFTYFTDPYNSDSDGDGITDSLEVLTFGTNPNKADSDDDGLNDYQEICYDGNCSAYTPGADTNPNNLDTDGDGFLDGDEVDHHTNPLDPLDYPSLVYSESFVYNSWSEDDCSAWNTFRGKLTETFNKIIIKGSFDPVGVSCTGPVANTVCHAIRDNSSGNWGICDGRTWFTGYCSNGTWGPGYEVTASTIGYTNCACLSSSQAYTVRPCIANNNWGGAGTNTCSAPSQTLTVICE